MTSASTSETRPHHGNAPGAFVGEQQRGSAEVMHRQAPQRYEDDGYGRNSGLAETAGQHYARASSVASSRKGRQSSVDDLNFNQMSLMEHGQQATARSPNGGNRSNSRNDARAKYPSGSSSVGQASRMPRPSSQRGVSMHSNHSGRETYDPPYEGASELPYGVGHEQMQQTPLPAQDPASYPSNSAANLVHDPNGQYVQRQYSPEYQHQLEQHDAYQQQHYAQHGYYDERAAGTSEGYHDPNQQYYAMNPQTGQYDYAGPSQQPHYAAEVPPASYGHYPEQYTDQYGNVYVAPPPSQSYQQHHQYHQEQVEVPGTVIGGSSYGVGLQSGYDGSNHSSGGDQPPLHRNRTSASAKTTGSGTSRNDDHGKPQISKQAVDDYRNRIKADPDPETQFNFARFLIEAARRLAVATKDGSITEDAKSVKKYRDSLLAEALKLVKRLATQGSGLGKPAYADAQFFLANCLGHGALGLAVDHEKAYNLYVQASKQNHPAATYRTAVCNEVGAGTRRDPARAVLFYRKASALGDTAGMYKLGMVLLNGLLSQPKNPREAVTWFKRAAAQADEENPHALHELAALYEKETEFNANGQPLPAPVMRDEAQAKDLYTQAAQLGHSPSQYKLGACYEYGSLTCMVDPRRSIAWYTRAAEKGHAESELALSGWYLTGSHEVLKQSDSEAYLWARRAANKGLSKAEYAVGYYSELGIGVKPDSDEAKMWYLRAAASGNRRAMQRLSELKKLGAKKGQTARPTRQQAANECIVS